MAVANAIRLQKFTMQCPLMISILMLCPRSQNQCKVNLDFCYLVQSLLCT